MNPSYIYIKEYEYKEMENNKWGIYRILNLINNKYYIGSSKSIVKRIREHKRLLRKGEHENKHLQSAWNKYGEQNFAFEIIQIISSDELKNNCYLRNLETKYILESGSANDKIGYNIINGGIGSLNTPCSEEKRRKISEANKGKTAWNKNIPMTEEQKAILRAIKEEKYGKSIDIYDIKGNFIETMSSVRSVSRKYKCGRNTINDCIKGKTLPKKYIFVLHGETLDYSKIGSNREVETDEHRKQRMKEYRSKRGKKIDVYTFDGKFINTYNSISEVHEELKIDESTVRRCINKKSFCERFIFKLHGDKTAIILDKPQHGWYGDTTYNVYRGLDILASFRNMCEVCHFIIANKVDIKKNVIDKKLSLLRPFEQIIFENFCVKLEPALSIGDNRDALP